MPAIRNLVAPLLAAFAASTAVAGPADGTWGFEGPPPGRFGHAAAYDPIRDRLLIFGGAIRINNATTLSSELLSLDLAGPEPRWDPTTAMGPPPPARNLHTMVYDPVRDRMLVFGGSTPSGDPRDVWALSLSGTPTWTKLAPSGTPPAARYGHVAVYDAIGDRMIVFGGVGGGMSYNDVWALSLSGTPAWTQLTPSGEPPLSRFGASAVLDTQRQRVVIFGGFHGNCNGCVGYYLGDVWELSLTGPLAWSPIVAGGTGPGARAFHAATYDAGRDEMVIHGGSNGPYLSDAFALSFADSATWSAIATPGGDPGPREWHTMVRDPLRDRDIVFAGQSSVSLGDLWSLKRDCKPAWTPILASTPYFFFARYGASLILDPVRDRLILFGGFDAKATVLGDLWEWPLQPGQAARPLVACGTPPTARQGASAIYDPVRDRMILYGGSTAGAAVVGEVWELALGCKPTWKLLSPAGTPPSVRARHTALYQPSSDGMIVFGGYNSKGWNAETWRLSLCEPMTWTRLTPPDPPSPRSGHVAFLDPVQDRMYVFGGDPTDDQLWRLELSGTPAWSVEPTAGPYSVDGATAIYDAARQRGVLFDGQNYYSNFAFELRFSASGAAWNQLTPDGTVPDRRFRPASAYDAKRDRMLVFGGLTDDIFSAPSNDLWSLQWQGVLDVDPTSGQSPLALAPPWPNPSRAGVVIPFTMPTAGHARVRVYDLHGRFVRELLNGPLAAGPQALRWDRRTAAGTMSRAGIYFVELEAAGQRRTQRIVATD